MARWVPNEANIDECLTGPTGPVYRYARDFADRVVVKAKEKAPVGLDDGGLLRDSIRILSEDVDPGDSITIRAGADPVDPRNGFRYALVAHEGHGVLRARPGGLMRFWWPAAGRFVAYKVVKPTSGTPYLTEAMDDVAVGTDFRLEPGEDRQSL